VPPKFHELLAGVLGWTKGENEVNSEPSEHLLHGQPSVLSIDRIDVEFEVWVQVERHALTLALVECGALEKSTRDQNEQKFMESPEWADSSRIIDVPLLKIPPKLIEEITENPLENLEVHMRIGARHFMGIEYFSGKLDGELEREVGNWLDSPTGWHRVAQERGDFASGYFFTEDVLLNFKPDLPKMTIEIIPRELLRREVLRQMVKMKAHVAGQTC
jgi:hypothetical protein